MFLVHLLSIGHVLVSREQLQDVVEESLVDLDLHLLYQHLEIPANTQRELKYLQIHTLGTEIPANTHRELKYLQNTHRELKYLQFQREHTGN